MKLDKKQLIIFISVAALVLVFVLAGYFIYQKQKIIPGEEKIKREEITREKQMEELEALHQQPGEESLTKKGLEAQKKELESLKKESGFQSPLDEETQKQLELLDKLRQ